MPNTSNNRGHSRGGFRGPTNGRDRGRGRGRGRAGRGRGRGGVYDLADQPDFVVQMWSDSTSPYQNQGNERDYDSPRNGSPRSRGRGGPFSSPNSGRATPSRGPNSPRGRGRGDIDHQNPPSRGRGNRRSNLRPDAPLSSLLYSERPLLRPIAFVPSVYTRTLFQEEEEILQGVVEELEDKEESHVPTADRITRVFSRNIEQMESSASDNTESDEDQLEEIDFADMAKIRKEVDMAPLPLPATSQQVAFVEERFTGFVLSTPKASSSARTNDPSLVVDHHIDQNTHHDEIHLEEPSNLTPIPSQLNGKAPPEQVPDHTSKRNECTGFFIDTSPAPAALSSRATTNDILFDRSEGVLPFGQDEPDEVIVYVAPHPRNGRVAPAIPAPSVPSFPSVSLVTGTTAIASATPPAGDSEQPRQSTSVSSPPAFESFSFSFANSPNPKNQPRHPPVFTPGKLSKAKLKVRKKEARAARKKVERQALFGSFGAIMQEAQLRGQGKDPRWEERRRDDSDVDWGDEDNVEKQDGVDELSSAGAMDLDPDLKLDVEVLERFVSGMGQNGGRFVTMDDIADEERMRLEDEEDEERGSSGEEEEEAVMEEERQMIAEPLDDDDEEDQIPSGEDDFSDDDGASPRTGFQARLERLRLQARSKRTSGIMPGHSSDDEGVLFDRQYADEYKEFMAHLEDVIIEDDEILRGTRREKNRLFKAIHNGNAADMADMSPAYVIKRGKQKGKDIPPDLLEQWEKDRAKKAENKRARQQARLQLAADPLSIKKHGKKGHKAVLAAARLDSSAPILDRVVDMTTLVQQIRRFLADVGGRSTMVLPPMEKWDRAIVHELANAFNMKSLSKGGGKGRYTTLSKTTRSGMNINEKKIGKIIARSGKGRFLGPVGDRVKGKAGMPRHKDGDEVGKAAPKIGQSNIGFKMLSSMGWAEGDRIGASADGLHVPLTAVMKNTKLGLGANR